MQAPSVTKTFGTVWTWFHPFRIDVFGSRPIRAVPISWMHRPGALPLSNVVTLRGPRAAPLPGRPRHVLAHRELVLLPAAVEGDRRQPPLVAQVLVQRHLVRVVRQALTP